MWLLVLLKHRCLRDCNDFLFFFFCLRMLYFLNSFSLLAHSLQKGNEVYC